MNFCARLIFLCVTVLVLTVNTAAALPPSQPVTVAFIGDSMADGLWGAMFRRLGKDKCLADEIKLIRHAKNGTGLARLDHYNWIDKVRNDAAHSGVDLFVGSFGVNDRQAIVDASKARIEYGTPEFDVHYQANVVDLVGAAMSNGAGMKSCTWSGR